MRKDEAETKRKKRRGHKVHGASAASRPDRRSRGGAMKRADGGAADDQMSPMEMQQAMYDHISARGDMAANPDPGDYEDSDKGKAQQKEDVQNYHDTFGEYPRVDKKHEIEACGGYDDRKRGGGIHIKSSHAGRLHRDLGVAKGQPISEAKMEKAKAHAGPAEKKRIVFAENARHWNHKGGS